MINPNPAHHRRTTRSAHRQRGSASPHDLPAARHHSGASAEKLTVRELCDELKISRSTFYDWRQKGRGPRCIRLPNGDLRIHRCDLDDWLTGRETAAGRTSVPALAPLAATSVT